MIVHTACCDGNLMLGLGPQWNGEFAEAQKKRLLEIGDWLKRNGPRRFIYARRSLEIWRVGRRDPPRATVYLHVVRWHGETLRLPAIPDRRVKSARLLAGKTISFKQSDVAVEIKVPKPMQDHMDTIVELTLDRTVDGLNVLDAREVCSFDAITYGEVVSRQAKVTTSSRHPADRGTPQSLVEEKPAADFAFHTAEELNPWLQIDLGREFAVTGVRVLNRVDALVRPGWIGRQPCVYRCRKRQRVAEGLEGRHRRGCVGNTGN